MYSYFKGEITEITSNHITCEVAGVGYLIKVPNPYAFPLNSNVTVYVHHHVKEDAIELYGFLTKDERTAFEKLISVKGLGPKGALAILASTTPQEMVIAIENAEAKFFSKFPGIGTKLSQQIILDLKGKLDFSDSPSALDPRIEETGLALKSLGYSNSEIKNVLKKLKLEPNTTLSDAVKMALKLLKN